MEYEFIKYRANRLKALVQDIRVDNLEASDLYSNNFLFYQKDLDYILKRYSYLLYKACEKKNEKGMSLLDFGGGTGFLGLLGKLCGISKVVYMDISDKMCNGAMQLARLCDIALDDYIVGSYENIKEICPHKFDAIANYDVLEHLYDPIEAFRKLGDLLKRDGIILMASSANKYNPVICHIYRRYHNICENKGAGAPSFLNVRKNIIRKAFPDLTEKEIETLSFYTRSRRREDILKAVTVYMNSGRLPKLSDRTNTCDPITGNGSENLLNIYKIVQILKNKFRFSEIGTGYFPITRVTINKIGMRKNSNIINNTYPYLQLLAKFSAPVLNFLIYILPLETRIAFSPYYYISVHK